MAKKILLLDISHLFFRAFYAFPRNLTDRESKPINAVFGVAQMLLTTIEKENPHYIFGGKDLAKKTFRSEKLESYKANRAELDPDLREQIPRIYDFFDALNLPVFSEVGYEADDMIGSMAEKFRGNTDFQVEILTGDADAFQLIGDNVFVLKPVKGENEKFCRNTLFEKKGFYPEEVVDFKAMAGDSSDNLKGVAGIGEKGAIKLIREYGNLEKIFAALEAGEIKGAMAKKLTEGREDAFFTREMAELITDRTLKNFSLDAGNIQNFSVENAMKFFDSIGSQTLQNRVKNILGTGKEENFNTPQEIKIPEIQKKEESQGSLF
jgi:DNA polymerase-1